MNITVEGVDDEVCELYKLIAEYWNYHTWVHSHFKSRWKAFFKVKFEKIAANKQIKIPQRNNNWRKIYSLHRI